MIVARSLTIICHKHSMKRVAYMYIEQSPQVLLQSYTLDNVQGCFTVVCTSYNRWLKSLVHVVINT